MRAASYIGRVGGLAVALGVGTAVFTGAGVAHATEGDDSGTGGAPAGQEQGGGGTTTAVKDAESGGPGEIDLKLPRLSDIIGRHRADDTTPNSNTATSIVKRLSDAAKRVNDAIENAAEADNTVVRSTTNTGDSSLQDRTGRTERTSAAVDPSTEGGATQTNNVVANQFTNRAAAVKDWIASPRALAGRSIDTTPTVSAPTPLWTPPQVLAPFGTMKATPGTGSTAVRTTSLLTTVLGVVNPFAGNSPGSPTGVGSPLSLVLAGAARREIGVESYTPTALLAPSTNSLTYDPIPTLQNGVITWDNGPTTGLTYTVVSDPSGGGKVLLDPTTGSFSFLPNLSSVTGKETENFSVLVAESTPFTTALTQIPLVGTFVPQVLVVLHQIPVINAVLSPIIGRSTVVVVPIDVGELAYTSAGVRKPVAFTVMVESFDGTLISTNYFPATTVVSGATTVAPTILNGPGLATAGNTDPNSVMIVDGIVPGLQPLRDAGYNVVTWDPRGEFASTGKLQLDSPDYEGRDVAAIITWVADNGEYTYPEMEGPASDEDPWIGMVGGSYGGGIQLVSTYVDDRIDVIVPAIAWNSLNDSLYTNEAFKTSYSSLLLLGLVTSGARINPQIYSGIITGAVIGILTPSQQQLLKDSGPWYFTEDITIPTMFLQGTVDVLFPLQQSIRNAEGISTAPEDIRMVWFCGGHGVCLNTGVPQDQQQLLLRNNTLAWLDRTLPEEVGNDPNTYDEVPRFQWVDQNGNLWKSDYLPFETDFKGAVLNVTPNGGGGVLGIVPILGGSGPQIAAGFPYSLGLGSPATNAITIPITPGTLPAGDTYVVGAPKIQFDYSGIGTSRHVYAQIVDKETGLVVGNIVTPVDVVLDGRSHVASVDMEDIAWTYTSATDPTDPNYNRDNLELQIVSSATPYLNFTQIGYINVSNVKLTLPTAASAEVDDEPWPVPPPQPVTV